jgi:hypothetical protein
MKTSANPTPDTGTRTLEQYLDELLTQLRLLPLNSRARGPLIGRIRQVEQAIDERARL